MLPKKCINCCFLSNELIVKCHGSTVSILADMQQFAQAIFQNIIPVKFLDMLANTSLMWPCKWETIWTRIFSLIILSFISRFLEQHVEFGEHIFRDLSII